MTDKIILPLSLEEKDKFKIIGGNSNPELVKKICQELNVEPAKAIVGQFADEETRVEIEENIRGTHFFVIQSHSRPANHHIMEMCIMLDAAQRASAEKVIAVVVYYGYARQDRKTAPRTPISGRLIADILIAAGADKLIILDLHAGQIQGFFDSRHNPNHIYIRPVFLHDIAEKFKDPSSLIFVSPDGGGMERARSYAKRFGCPIAQIDKRREGPNKSTIMNVVGDVTKKIAILIDDIVDTGGTLAGGARSLKEKGATAVWAYCTHAVLSGDAVKNIVESPIEELVVSNSIPLSEKAVNCRKIRVLGVEKLLASTMLNVFRDESVSEMLEAF